MECRLITQHLDDLLDDALSDPLRGAMRLHLVHCAPCRRAFDEAQRLRALLRDWPVPPSPQGFHERVLRKAAAAQQPRFHYRALIGMALAASLALGVAIGLLLGDREADADFPAVALAVGEARVVQLAFDSARPLQDVVLALRLPGQVELVGYPGQHELSWRIDLQQGSNRLALPLIVHGGDGGALTAELLHGARSKVFNMRIDVQQRPDASRGATQLTL